MFFLLLLVSIAGAAYDSWRTASKFTAPPSTRQDAAQLLQEFVREFGAHLVELERHGVTLAEKIDSAKKEAGTVDALLEQAIRESPDIVEFVGVSRAGGGDDSRITSFLSKRETLLSADFARLLDADFPEGNPSAREINTERRISWKLLSAPVSEGASRFSCLLSVSLEDDDGTLHGRAIVVGGMDWLGEILGRLRERGAGDPFCVSPDHDVLWLENNVLYSDKDFPSNHFSPTNSISLLRRHYENPDAIPFPGLTGAEIIGTGWVLAISERPVYAEASESAPQSSIWRFFLVVAAAALVFEAAISALRENDGDESNSIEAALPPGGGTSVGQKERRGLLEWIGDFLFKYRITNPEQARIDSELNVARSIQFSLVPDKFPPYSQWREYDLYSLLSPAREVGGDYYDFFMLDPNRLVVTVGDVSGKSVPAALYMAVCRTAFRTLARSADDPGQLLARLNEMLVRDNQSGLYVTIACFFIDLPSGKCEYAIAGHPAPLWHKTADNTAEYVDEPRGTIIGMQYGLEFPVGTIRLRQGDTLLLYTDGVPDARGPDGSEIDFSGLLSRFQDAASSPDCRTLISRLEHSLQTFMAGSEQVDDITLMTFRYWGPGGQILPYSREAKSSDAAATGFPDSGQMEGI